MFARTLTLMVSLSALGGCAAMGLVASGIAETGTRTVQAKYDGLAGKSFAVVVTADRMIEADFRGVTAEITARMTDRLVNESGASGYVPPEDVLKYMYDHPRWQARPVGELAKELGVQRLVYIDLYDFRVHPPGNVYEWDGVAAGRVAVVAADSSVSDQYVFEQTLRLVFPPKGNAPAEQMTRQVVSSALLKRFVDRASWLFFTHEEPKKIDY